jgi:hypothetical protein
MANLKGSCHCGVVSWETTASITSYGTCNCSHCHRKGFELAFIKPIEFSLLSGGSNLTEYTFNKKSITHLFCSTCGVQSFGRGSDGAGNEAIMLNLRCIEGLDVSSLEHQQYDGKSF